MVVVLGILAALFLLATPVAYVLGVLTGRLAYKRVRAENDTLTKQLARQRTPQPTHTVSISHGVPVGILLQHTPEANYWRRKVVEHYQQHSGLNEEELLGDVLADLNDSEPVH
jgi:hypothetical protein